MKQKLAEELGVSGWLWSPAGPGPTRASFRLLLGTDFWQTLAGRYYRSTRNVPSTGLRIESSRVLWLIGKSKLKHTLAADPPQSPAK